MIKSRRMNRGRYIACMKNVSSACRISTGKSERKMMLI
jgi:hypothetical protein